MFAGVYGGKLPLILLSGQNPHFVLRFLLDFRANLDFIDRIHNISCKKEKSRSFERQCSNLKNGMKKQTGNHEVLAVLISIPKIESALVFSSSQ